jgi:hypothetical protein
MMQPEDLSAARGAGMSPAAGDAAESPEALRRAIAQTRADIGRTVQEIKERVNRQHLMEHADQLRDQAVEAAREATVGRADELVSKAGEAIRGAASRSIKTVRAHPIPALLAVALLGFLAYQLRSR